MLVTPEGYAQITHKLVWTGDPETMVVTYGVSCSAAASGDANDIAIAAGDAFANALMTPIMSSVITLTGTEASFQAAAPPAPPEVGTDTTVTAGTQAGNLLPQNCALLAHKRTAFAGRGGRGRIYIPGAAEAIVDNTGGVSPTSQGEWNTALADLLTGLTATAFIDGMVLLHDSLGAFAATAPHPVTALQLDPVIATQRRRLRR